ncbi:hypothetical protein H920_02422 [Fukomys damarensis]|uniref:Uncharacterized protein n=1 Tax=Fukomys damarensis TaxID=885580 RepID=A0A091E119_FUKDA|nr:hypothetical protein H920_02422 [Fukomys damarensis]
MDGEAARLGPPTAPPPQGQAWMAQFLPQGMDACLQEEGTDHQRPPLSPKITDSEPSTSDSRSSPTLFLSSEEPGPCTATQPVSPVSPCKPAPSPPGLPVPAGCSPPAPITGLGLGVTSSPDATPRAPGNENPEKDPGVQDPFLGPNVGDLLAELRTMNSHLGVIARALTKLASALGPQPPVDTQDAN